MLIRALCRFMLLPFFLGAFFLTVSPALADNNQTTALVMKALSNPFFIKLDQGAREYAARNGIPLEVFGIDRETDVDNQISIVEDLISRGYGAIIIAPADSVELIPVCKKALEKGIKVINIDNPLDKKTMSSMGISIPFIGPDNYAGGELVGTYLKKKLNGTGKVLLIEGIPGVSNSDDRKNGFIAGVTENSAVEIVRVARGNWHRDEAFSEMVKALDELDRIDAVFCANDVMALGALLALELRDNAAPVLVAGYDNIELVRNEMGTGRIHATVEQHPEIMGAYGVEAAWKNLQGEDLPNHQRTPIDLITIDHIGKTLLLSVSATDNPFFSTLLKNAKAEAERFGMQLRVLDAKNQDAKQLVDIVNALDNNPDLLILNPTNSATVSPILETAESYRVPVITVDRQVAGGKILSHIASDNKAGGSMAAEFIAQRLNGSGRIMEIEGIPGTSAAYNRGAGFNETIDRYKNLTVVYRLSAGFDRKSAEAVMKKYLLENPHIDGVFAHNDNMILGLLDAYRSLAQTPPRVLVGFDGIDEAVADVREGRLSATIAQRPDLMGQLVIYTAARYFRGEKIEPVIHVDLNLISR